MRLSTAINTVLDLTRDNPTLSHRLAEALVDAENAEQTMRLEQRQADQRIKLANDQNTRREAFLASLQLA